MEDRSNVDAGSLLDSVVLQNYIYLASLIIALWDYIDTLQGEIKHIWSLPSNQTKFTFLYARYLGLAFQVINAVMSFTRMSYIPVPYDVCKGWYIFQISAFYAQYAAGELVLSKKVFHMYERSHHIGLILGMLRAGDFTIAAICSRNAVQMLTFDSVCNGLRIPSTVFVFLAGVLVNQTIIWTLIFRKLWISESGRKETRLQLSVRIGRIWLDGDAKWTWLLFCLSYVFTIPQAFLNQHVKPYRVFSWPITLLSIGTCRLILNMEKIAQTKARLSKGAYKFPRSTQQPQTAPSARTIPLQTFRNQQAADVSSIRTETTDVVFYDDSQSGFSVTSTSQSNCDSRTETLGSGQSSADIEIGSLQTTSSITSEELRDFWNDSWNAGPGVTSSRRSSTDSSHPYNHSIHDYVNR